MKKDHETLAPPPDYCDFSCRHAEFGDPSSVGACMKDIGVWCALERRFNRKHAHCLIMPAAGNLKSLDKPHL
jgi:hypothetical protein